jgi:hypothetical protein
LKIIEAQVPTFFYFIGWSVPVSLLSPSLAYAAIGVEKILVNAATLRYLQPPTAFNSRVHSRPSDHISIEKQTVVLSKVIHQIVSPTFII